MEKATIFGTNSIGLKKASLYLDSNIANCGILIMNFCFLNTKISDLTNQNTELNY